MSLANNSSDGNRKEVDDLTNTNDGLELFPSPENSPATHPFASQQYTSQPSLPISGSPYSSGHAASDVPPPSSSQYPFADTSLSPSLLPHSPLVDCLLTDLYQITMCYAYWKNDRHNQEAVFDLFYRQHPFEGEFTIFAGLEEALRFVHSFKFQPYDIALLQERFPDWVPEFWNWLATLDCSQVKIFGIQEGTIVIPRVPLMRVEGPLAICQLLESTLLVLVNYPSLIATNAARHRLAVGPSKTLMEFGLRRAQGPDGAVTGSRYAYMGGFDGTSNVKAGLMFDIPMQGTHAHSFVNSFLSMEDLKLNTIQTVKGETRDFIALVLSYRQKIGKMNTNAGELAAFTAYGQAYPSAFLPLLDTYDVLESGVHNFIFVALALAECGYAPKGVRLDSGDLGYLSKEVRRIFKTISHRFSVNFIHLIIVASNDLSEAVLYSLKEQGHEIDSFAIGTHLITCKNQPALGCVYKLVQLDGIPRIKVSQDSGKITIPGKKEAYRLYSSNGSPVLDLLITSGTTPPAPFMRILCRHPFDANKRVYVTPAKVVPLHQCVWDGGLVRPFESLKEVRYRVREQLIEFREDHLRRLNPTPYKLSVSSDLYTYMHDLWLSETSIPEIK